MDLDIRKNSGLEEKILALHNSKFGKMVRILWEGVPVVSTMYNSIIGGIEKRNLLVLIENLIDKKIVEYINNNELDDEKWSELLQHAILKTLRCSKVGQIKQIANILSGKCSSKIETFNDAEDLINIVSELSENEANVLGQIYDIFKKKTKAKEEIKSRRHPGEITVTVFDMYVTWAEIESELPAFKERLDFFIGRLEGKGLIKEKLSVTHADIGNADDGNKKYIVTFTGNMLFRSINNENSFRE